MVLPFWKVIRFVCIRRRKLKQNEDFISGSLLHSLLVNAMRFCNTSQTFNILQIIQLIYSNSSADLYSHNTVFELPVTPVMFVGEAVYQKLLVACLLKLSQMCSKHKSKSSIMNLSYKFAEINFTLNIKAYLQI